MSSETEGKVIYELPLGSLSNTIVDISPTATAGRFRLVNCIRYTRDHTLHVAEYTDISNLHYSAISYIWKGNPADDSDACDDSGTFSVKAAEDGDPISIDVLHHACTASLLESATHLWLDRLCIIQASRDDKAWQIARMYQIYKSCQVCIVLPGGVGRLVSDEEETKWITRAWTLQEVTAPQKPIVLFRWERGTGQWEGWQGGVKGRVTEVISKKSAMISLVEILKACFYPMALTWTSADGSEVSDDISPSILGSYGDSLVGSLLWALQLNDPDGRDVAIWQSALLRTSSRPVDMILSMMGTFGVTLDARKFHKNDRIGATIALAQEILRRGGKPTWLAMSLDIPPSRYLSSFPDFPTTDVEGDVYWRSRHGPVDATVDDDIYDIDELNEIIDEVGETVDGSNVVLSNLWIENMPEGIMDDNGYLTITSRAAPAVFTGIVFGKRRTNLAKNNDGTVDLEAGTGGTARVVATDGKVWDILNHSDGHTNHIEHPRAFIVFIGVGHKFPQDPVFQYDPRPFGGIILPEVSTLRALALEEHSPGRFHRSSAFTLSEGQFKKVIEGWRENTFAIGGPEPLPAGTAGITQPPKYSCAAVDLIMRIWGRCNGKRKQVLPWLYK